MNESALGATNAQVFCCGTVFLVFLVLLAVLL